MIHRIPRQIAYISTFTPLHPGDVCEIVVDAIGTLRNGIRDEA